MLKLQAVGLLVTVVATFVGCTQDYPSDEPATVDAVDNESTPTATCPPPSAPVIPAGATAVTETLQPGEARSVSVYCDRGTTLALDATCSGEGVLVADSYYAMSSLDGRQRVRWVCVGVAAHDACGPVQLTATITCAPAEAPAQ